MPKREERLEPGSIIIHDALYWVPLLAKATLARREELCGLDVEDVVSTGSIPFINLCFSDHRLLKIGNRFAEFR